MSGISKLEDFPGAKVATLAGGCFWCIEVAFDGREGVFDSISGFAGGSALDASYRLVASGQTEHREAVQIYYDPEILSFEEILSIFWRQIDPTDAGGQFADRGYHYSTAIYYHDQAQKDLALASKKALEMSDKFDEPIVTEVLPYTTFFPAAEEHQHFARKRREYYKRYKEGSGRGPFIRENWK